MAPFVSSGTTHRRRWCHACVLTIGTGLAGISASVVWAQVQAPSTASRLAPALDPAARREALTGRWFGETSMPDGQVLRWVTDRDVNGTYRTQYHATRSNGETEESVEMGQWGLSGGVYFTLQRAWIRNGENLRADPANVYSSDAYDLLSINDRTIDYRSVGSGKRFTAKRVGPEFRLPGRINTPAPAAIASPAGQKRD